VEEAKRAGAFTVEINPIATGAGVDLTIAMPAEEALPLVAGAFEAAGQQRDIEPRT
jgi:hypothetical protein